MASKFDTCRAHKDANALHTTPELKTSLMHLFDTQQPHPTTSTNEERVAYLENQRLKSAVSRVLDAL